MEQKDALRLLREAAPELKRRYGVIGASLFGSVARGDADSLSDIDVAVRFAGGGPVDVMAVCGVSGFLSGVFGVAVDVVALPAKNIDLASAIDREAAVAF